VPETAAILIEPIQGEGGVRVLSLEFLRGLRKLCDEHGLLLIFDEIQTGIGRTGKLFAYEWLDMAPDIMPIAKGIGGGYPIGACLATAEAAKGMTPGTHGSTYGGNPLGMAVGNAVLDLVLAPDFLPHVQAIANYLNQQLVGLLAAHLGVFEEVRGQGLMLGLKLRVPNTEFVAAARKQGLLVVGASDNVVRILPPLIVEETQVREAMTMLSAAAKTFESDKKTEAA
jgi:acetylornithine/N-succinyldiaminopimelate aminotransferase